MKKILGLFCVFCLCGMTTFQGMAVVKSGRCDIHRADKMALPDIIGGAIGGGIGWATGGAIGASLAPFTLIGRGMVDPVVGTLRINGAPLVSSVAGAVVGGKWGAGVASKIYSGDDYLCFDKDINKCLQCDVHQIGDAYECGDTHVVIGPKFAKRCNASRNPFVKDVWEDFKVPECPGNKVIESGRISVNIKTSSWKDLTDQGAQGWLVVNRDACYEIDCDTDHGWYYDSASRTCKERKVDPTPNNNTCTATIKGKTVVLDPGAESSIDLTATECSAAVKVAHGGASFDPNGRYHFYCGPMCKKVGCQSGYENDENGTCVKKGGDKKTCRERRAGMSIEAIACCDTGTDATWDKPIKGKCNCKDSNTHFEIVGDRGQCVANVTPPVIPPVIIPPVDPVPEPCTDPDNMDSNCKCVVPETVERGGKCVCRDSDKVIKNGKCEYSDEYIGRLEIELDSKYSGLTATIGGFEKNVWRDENGEFNTARLASDSIAGVVLGTVGGIVTANLVKKAQIKQGFEDIGCYIGGQSVAGYGDEFYVGR